MFWFSFESTTTKEKVTVAWQLKTTILSFDHRRSAPPKTVVAAVILPQRNALNTIMCNQHVRVGTFHLVRHNVFAHYHCAVC